MKFKTKVIPLLASLSLVSCGEKTEKQDAIKEKVENLEEVHKEEQFPVKKKKKAKAKLHPVLAEARIPYKADFVQKKEFDFQGIQLGQNLEELLEIVPNLKRYNEKENKYGGTLGDYKVWFTFSKFAKPGCLHSINALVKFDESPDFERIKSKLIEKYGKPLADRSKDRGAYTPRGWQFCLCWGNMKISKAQYGGHYAVHFPENQKGESLFVSWDRTRGRGRKLYVGVRDNELIAAEKKAEREVRKKRDDLNSQNSTNKAQF